MRWSTSASFPGEGTPLTLRARALTRNNGNRQSLSAPLAREQGVDELALPLALDPFVLAQVRLAPHAELLEHARRGAVARLQPAAHAMQPVGPERDRQHAGGRLGRVAAALVVRVEDEADLPLPVRLDRERDVADELTRGEDLGPDRHAGLGVVTRPDDAPLERLAHLVLRAWLPVQP